MKSPEVSEQLRALGPQIRILAVVIDVAASSGWPLVLGERDDPETKTAFEHPIVESARIRERRSGEGWRPTRTKQRLRDWGLADKATLFDAAGLTENQRKVMTARYPDHHGPTPMPREIARELGWPALRVRVHLHEGYKKLQDWARLVEPLNDPPISEGELSFSLIQEGSFGSRLSNDRGSKRGGSHHVRPLQRGLSQLSLPAIPIPEDMEPAIP